MAGEYFRKWFHLSRLPPRLARRRDLVVFAPHLYPVGRRIHHVDRILFLQKLRVCLNFRESVHESGPQLLYLKLKMQFQSYHMIVRSDRRMVH